MSNLPRTSEQDLQAMGITADKIKEALEKSGEVVRGKVAGLFFPSDNYKGDHSIRQAQNYLKSDWTLVEEKPPVVVHTEFHNDSWNHFKAREATHGELKQTVSITTGTRYRLTKPFKVNVNANIPLGKKAPIKFTATDKEADVENKSSVKTESRDIPFTVDVPAGEGRIVNTTVTQTSTDTVFKALIGIQGTVGVEISTWYRPNYYRFIYKIEDLFPEAAAKSEIVKSQIDTKVETIIKKADSHKAGDIIQYHSPIGPQRTIDPAPLIKSICNWLIKSLKDRDGSSLSADFPCDVTVRVNFHNENPIPVKQRETMVQVLILGIESTIQPQGCIGSIETATWQPDREARDQATFCIPFDPAKISREDLILQFLKTANGVAWNGPHLIHFT